MSSQDQEILRLQAKLARLKAEQIRLEALNRKLKNERKKLEAANSKISDLEADDQKKQAFIIAPLPEMIIPKEMALESPLADILINKYLYNLPFYHQIQKYRELGVVLSDSTIGDWFNAVCSKLRPLYDMLHERIMS